MNDGRVKALGMRYYGDLAAGRTDMIANAVLVGFFKPMLEAGVTPVNARNVAHERGIEIIESRSTRTRNYTQPALGEAAHAATANAGSKARSSNATMPRLVMLDGIGVEAPLEGTMIVIRNTDQPGVIGADRDDPRPPQRQHRELRARTCRATARSASSSSTRPRQSRCPCSMRFGR